MSDLSGTKKGLTTQSVRVAVIGGGIVGASILYWLTRLGWTDVLLLERRELTHGSTWHAAGNVTTFHGLYNLTRIQKYSMETYRALDRATGGGVGMKRIGSLFLAHHQGQMDEYRMQMGRSKLLDLGYELVTPEEACALHPFMAGEGLVGALYDADYGPIDPTGATNALAAAAKKAGATILRRTAVTGLEQRPDGTWWVTTEAGRLHAGIVVNAAGFWAAEVAAMAGLHQPVIAVEHQYLVTESIPAIAARKEPFPAIRGGDASFYMRREGNGLLVGAWEADNRVWGIDGVPKGFGAELFQPDLDRIEKEILAASVRVPLLAEAGIKRIVNGPFAFGPDAKPHLGPVRGARNFFSAVGFTAGIAQGGGAGRVLAEWIVEGRPSVDLTALDADRFGDYATRRYLIAKVQECYAKRFSVPYPEEERPAGRPAKTSPLYERLKAAGAVYGALSGWERPMWFARNGDDRVERPSFRRPNWFDSVGKECRALRSAAGLLDLSSFAKYSVEGPGAAVWLDGIFAKPVPARIGRVGLRLMLDREGGVIGDLTVARLAADRFYILGAAAAQHYHTRWLETLLPPAGVRFAQVTGRYGVLALAGPRSREILAAVTHGDLSNQALPFFGATEIEIGMAKAIILRVAYTGELGYELHLPTEHLLATYDLLKQAGMAHGLIDFGMRAMNCLRLEKGYRRLGSDLTPDTTPFEAGMEGFVALDGPDFIGRDALLRAREKGPRRRLAMLEVDAADADAVGNEPVFEDGQIVGYVSSGGYGHTVGKSLALAYLRPDLAGDGHELAVEILGERRRSVVIPDTVYDPNGGRLRS
jgi:dimethylglycine dehydrogenase